MDESKIVAKLIQNIPQHPATTPEPAVLDPDQPIDHTHLDYEDPVLNQRLSDYFELPQMAKYTEDTQRQLRTVLEWANQMSESIEPADLMLIIQRVERELGIIHKPNRLARVYRFVRIQEQAVGLDKEMELLKG